MLMIKRMSGALALFFAMAAFASAQTSIMQWNAGPNLQFPRDTGSAVTQGGTIYVFGGNTAIPTSFT